MTTLPFPEIYSRRHDLSMHARPTDVRLALESSYEQVMGFLVTRSGRPEAR